MKYVQINTFPNKSTGTIMMQKHRELLAQGEESYVFWGRGRNPENKWEYKFGSRAGVYLDGALTRLFGRAGFYSRKATKELLEKLDDINPDVVHLHNLHGYYLNIEMLFKWLVNHSCEVRWTLHDCWALTGHCIYFTYIGCEQWKNRCSEDKTCPQIATYPKTISRRSCLRNYEDKKRIFTSVSKERMTIITPSHWLENLVKKSFLNDYLVEVHRNAIDAKIFQPTPSNFRKEYGIGNRFMILGVASPWTERKGLLYFIQLAESLNPEKYSIVLVGLSKKQIRKTCKKIIGITHTENALELAKIYSAADLLIQPSIEETFGMTVAEAQACGTSVLVVKDSACEEIAEDRNKFVIEDLSSLKEMVIDLSEKVPNLGKTIQSR